MPFWFFALYMILIAIYANSYDSPLSPRYANCNYATVQSLTRKTNKKYFLCSMFKNEEGYLSEFVAYYKIQGINHIMLWNHGSTDNFESELYPWIQSGFVQIRNTNELINRPYVVELSKYKSAYAKVIGMQKEVERQCISWGIKNHYDYYLTVDMDEYILPFPHHPQHPSATILDQDSISIVDTVEYMFKDKFKELSKLPIRKKGIYNGTSGNNTLPLYNDPNAPPPTINSVAVGIVKHNYNSIPYLMEPMDLLTIESYLNRYETPGHMNFYMHTQPKFLYRLKGNDLSSVRMDGLEDQMKQLYIHKIADDQIMVNKFTDAQIWLSNCCFMHGCEYQPNRKHNPICGERPANWMSLSVLRSKHNKSPYWLRVNHYWLGLSSKLK